MDFAAEVQMHHGLVLVEFYTPSCGPCKQLEPHLRRLSDDLAGQVKVVKVNSNTSPQSVQTFGIQMAPTLMLFHGGRVLNVIRGNPGPARLRSFVQSVL